MRQVCKEIIDHLAEASGVANGTIGNLNMATAVGVEPTDEERRVLGESAEAFCRTMRAMVRQWLARMPVE